ncbi:iron uptake transporter permease EfeU [Rothia aeria]|uniref:iron uptake transporter permease EfeU n=1 Tax=Rothia aeria TaxID=172042 RepID=UPI00051CDC81|nr:iron uptake transporter permease EfeU [Rothia aeria]KGJ35105.1 high-affinity Fe2+/Pb2+ permease [Rothia aeria]
MNFWAAFTGNFLIGLREGLEAALVVGILIAYIHKTQRTHLLPKVWAGVAFAVVVSLGFGALLTYGPKTLTFEAQEAIGGSLSIIAVGFVTWMIFWMAENARALSTELHTKLDAVQGSTWAVVLLATLSVGREGLETTLFIWSATQAATAEQGSADSALPVYGALTGIIVAVLLAWAMMRGIMKINLAKFFTWTGAFLIIIAAGVFSYGLHDLQEANILPGLNNVVFESYKYIDPSSFLGTMLKAVFNLSSTTTWIEAIAWVLYVGIIMTLFFRVQLRHRRVRQSSAPKNVAAAANSTPENGGTTTTQPLSDGTP